MPKGDSVKARVIANTGVGMKLTKKGDGKQEAIDKLAAALVEDGVFKGKHAQAAATALVERGFAGGAMGWSGYLDSEGKKLTQAVIAKQRSEGYQIDNGSKYAKEARDLAEVIGYHSARQKGYMESVNAMQSLLDEGSVGGKKLTKKQKDFFTKQISVQSYHAALDAVEIKTLDLRMLNIWTRAVTE